MGIPLAQLLAAVLDPKTQSEASLQLKAYFGSELEPVAQVEVVRLLLEQAISNANPGIRQLACIIVRRRIVKTWSLLPQADQQSLWAQLRRSLLEDPDSTVRMALAQIVAAIGKVTITSAGAEFMHYVTNDLCCSTNSDHRVSGQVITKALIDALKDAMGTTMMIQSISNISLGLEDTSSSEVVMAALRALTSAVLASSEQAESAAIRKLLPRLVATIKAASASSLHNIVSGVMDALNEMAENGEIFEPTDLSELVKAVVTHVGMCEDLEVGIREQAFHFVHCVAEQTPEVLSEDQDLLTGVLTGLIQIACQPDEADEDADGEAEDQVSTFRMACHCMDSLAIFLPSSVVLGPALNLLNPLLVSTNVYERRAALVLLGLLSEGCENLLRHHVDRYVPIQLAALKDPSEIVRGAAGLGLGQMAEFLQPEILRFTEPTVQTCTDALISCTRARAALSSLGGARYDQAINKLCYALEVFCVGCTNPAFIREPLPKLVPALMRAMETTRHAKAKESCIAALAAVADAAKLDFNPYLDTALLLIENVFAANTKENKEVPGFQSKCIHLMGRLISALHGSISQECKAKLVEIVIKTLLANKSSNGEEFEETQTNSKDTTSLREDCYNFISTLVACTKNEVLPLVPLVLPCLFATIYSTDGLVNATEGFDLGWAAEDDDGDLDDSDDRFEVCQGAVDELVAALHTLTAFYINLSPEHVMPYVQKVMEAVPCAIKHFYPGTRIASVDLCVSVLIATHNHYRLPWYTEAASPTYDELTATWQMPNQHQWAAGYPARCLLASEVKTLWFEHVWMHMADTLVNEGDSSVVSETARALSTALLNLGPAALAYPGNELSKDFATLITGSVAAVFESDHPSQTKGGFSFPDEGDKETCQREEELFEGIGILLGSLAEVLGPELIPQVFDSFHPALLKLINHTKSPVLRCNGLGVYIDILKTLGNAKGATLSKYVDAVAPTIESGIRNEYSSVLRQNSSYCAGIMVQVAPTHASVLQHLPGILQAALESINHYQCNPLALEISGAVVDNLASFLARLILYLPPSILNLAVQQQFMGGRDRNTPFIALEQLCPIFCSCLPLREDFPEVIPCAEALMRLAQDTRSRVFVKQNFQILLEALVLMLTEPRNSAVLAKTPGVAAHVSLKREMERTVVYMFNVIAEQAGLPILADKICTGVFHVSPVDEIVRTSAALQSSEAQALLKSLAN